MARSPEEFARLLTEGIHRIRLREPDKLISTIQKELGRALGRDSGSAIEYWRKGHIPANPSDVEKLAREILQRSDLGREWLERFLESAGYPDPSRLCCELFPPLSPTHIPGKQYRELVGRDLLVDEILAALRDPHGRWIVAIDGMGGIGKTALAREVVERCLKEHLFDAVVWVSAAGSKATPGDEGGESGALTFDAVLESIGYQLGASDVSKRTTAEKEARVRELLRERRVLVVLDNLETAEDPQDEIARRLQALLNPSKALLVSRHRFLGDLYRVHLTGLDPQSALDFIHQEAREKRIGRVEMADPDELTQIVQATGGSPLAMKLVVGQLGHLPLETVLKHLREVRPLESESDEDDYIRFYKFIYLPAWQLLSDTGKKLLISMALFIPGVGGTLQAIRATVGLTKDVPNDLLIRHIHALWRLSLLEVGETPESGLKEVRYYLHPLTQYFVLSDIVNGKSAEERQQFFREATRNFVNYYVDYVKRHGKDYAALDAEAHTILEALRKASEQGAGAALVQGANAFYTYLETRGLYRVAEVHLERARQAAQASGDVVSLATTLLHLGIAARRQGKYPQAETHLQEGLTLARDAGRRELVGELLTNLGAVAVEVGAYDSAEAHWLEALALAKERGRPETVGELLQNLGLLADIRGNYAQAEGYLQEGLTVAREIGDPGRISALLQSLAVVAFNVGDYARAEGYLEEALMWARRIGDVRRVGHVLATLGAAAFCRGDFATAEQRWREGLALLREIDYPTGLSSVLSNLGMVLGCRGDDAGAEAYLQEGLALARRTGHKENVAYALEGLGALAVRRGNYTQAKAYLTKGLNLARELEHRELISAFLCELGVLALARGDCTQAEAHLREGLELTRKIGHRWYASAILNEWGELHLRRRDWDAASQAFHEALMLAREMDAKEHLARALYGLARVAAARGQMAEAQRRGRESLSLLEAMGHYKTSEVKAWLAALPCEHSNGV